MKRVWVIAPFLYEEPEQWQEVWQNNLKHGFISLGFRNMGNVSKLDKEGIRDRCYEIDAESSANHVGGVTGMLYRFWNELSIGDTVVARKGRKCIAALGTIKSEPYYSKSKAKRAFGEFDAYANHIDVEWSDKHRDVEYDSQVFGMQALHEIEPSELKRLLAASKESAGTDKREYKEGGCQQVTINRYERNAKARAECLLHHGYRCAVCGMSFAEVYGEIGLNFIHVHHVTPVTTRKKSSKIQPHKDLVPVCPNCHAMLHQTDPPININKLKSLLEKQRKRLKE